MKTEEKRNIRMLDGKVVECTIQHGIKKTGFLGKTLGKKILLPCYLFEDYGEDTQNFVVHHEYAHWRSSFIETIWEVCIAVLAAAPFIVSPASIAVSAPIGLIIIKWPIEGNADYCAIKSVGRETAIEAIKELAEKREMSMPERLWNRVLHPPKEWSLKLYDMLNPTGR